MTVHILTKVPVVWIEAQDPSARTIEAFTRAFTTFGMESCVVHDAADLARIPADADVAIWIGPAPPTSSALHIAIGVDAEADIMLRGDELEIERLAASAVAPLIER